VDWMKTWGY